jgi:hypothetical protein
MRATIKYIAPWLAGVGAVGMVSHPSRVALPSLRRSRRPKSLLPEPLLRGPPRHHSRMEWIRWCPPMWVLIPRCRSFPAWGGPSDTSCVASRASRTVEWDHNS